MKITFNNTIFYSQKKGGISRYIICLSKQLINLKHDINIIAPLHKNIYLKDFPKKNYKGFYFSRYPLLDIFKNYSEYFFNYNLKNNTPQIIHDTYYSGNIKKPAKVKKIITVHDLIHEKFKNLYRNHNELIELKKKAFIDCDHFICVSENTKKDLIDFYNIKEKKISVIYHGSEHLKNLDIKNKNNHKIFKNPYLLYVGNRNKYKNFINFVSAYSISKKLINNFNIICFGGGEFTYEENKKFSDLKIGKKIFQYSGSDEKLKNFYTYARALVFPSAYEGFGFPLIESMSLGCPVFCSNLSVMPEICGDAAIFFNPNNREEFLFKLENNLFNDEKINLLKKKGLNRSNQFTWKNTALKTSIIYKSLI